ncbi:RGS domain-containing protein [Cokeromyces recurvatus]|uniref:RGS domain-containing protein n=1 Tax=Cokeromyces recurvatus TaxID=90255 RepID=UPI002220E7F4|nr:RGS domain-containing protein [Cokeromyces recurvatus]KAI7907343.1 RGS domain-containing protein [Cokeromyces recurvatus]
MNKPIGISLESILNDPTSDIFNEFTTYLNQTYCVENLTFWLATQEYNKIGLQQERQELGERMIRLYILPNSSQEINIPYCIRQPILDFYYSHKDHYTRCLFNEAADSVLELMRANSFLPWISSLVNPKHYSTTWPFLTNKEKGTNASLKGNLDSYCQSCSFLDDMSLIHSSSSFSTHHNLNLDNNNNKFFISSAPPSISTTSSSRTQCKRIWKQLKTSLLKHRISMTTALVTKHPKS